MLTSELTVARPSSFNESPVRSRFIRPLFIASSKARCCDPGLDGVGAGCHAKNGTLWNGERFGDLGRLA
jgi:hypothetical protein